MLKWRFVCTTSVCCFVGFVVAAAVSSPAEATLSSFSNVTGAVGAVITDTPPNPVVKDPNDGILLAWNEVQNLQLQNDLAVDRVADPNAPFIQPDGSGGYLIKAGTYVSSHYLQWDPGTGSSNGVQATIHFDSEIFAFMTADQKLFDSDAFLGLPGLDYNDFPSRGLETGDTTVFNGSEVDIDWYATSPGDWTRLITAFSPAAAFPELTTNDDPGNPAVVDFGTVRIGGNAQADLTVRNDGDFGSNLSGDVPAPGAGEFALTEGTSFGPLGQAEGTTKTYRYSPGDRGPDQAAIGEITGDDTPDEDAPVTLQGRGVGPIADVPASAEDTANRNEIISLVIELGNITTDTADHGAPAAQTDLTILGSTHVLGGDAALFDIQGLPGSAIAEGGTGDILVKFLGSPDNGIFSTTLFVDTDENAPLGQAGTTFQVSLSVEVIPEPATLSLLALGGVTVLRRLSRRKNARNIFRGPSAEQA